jgi:hypothetical protein
MGRWFDMAVQKGQLGAVRSEKGLSAPFCTNCTDVSTSETEVVCMICGRPAYDTDSNLIIDRTDVRFLQRLHISADCYDIWFERAFGKTPKPEELTITKLPKP